MISSYVAQVFEFNEFMIDIYMGNYNDLFEFNEFMIDIYMRNYNDLFLTWSLSMGK